MTNLGDGLVLRPAEPADLDQLDELLTARGEAADAEDLRLVAADPDAGLEGTAVVVDGARVVSTATLLSETVELGDVPLPAGQVELVATDPAYEGRGLVRALMAWCHERSAARGDLVQVMVGIPYFYRQFGYEYAIPIARALSATRPAPGSSEGLEVRRATMEDVGAMAALASGEQAAFDVRMSHSTACWRWLVQRAGSQQWVATDGEGVVVTTGRTTPPDEGVVLGEVSASIPAGALALLDHSFELGGGAVEAKERPGTVAGDALAPLLAGGGWPDCYYVRLPDPVALLERLRPVLTRRLVAADLASAEQEVLISAFRWHVRFAVGPSGAGPMRGGGPLQAPGAHGGSGVAPDRFASLLFGEVGAVGLAEREPDVYLGQQEALMAALFPPVRADVLTFYLP